MDLLSLRARAGWSAARAGREFLLDPKTLASWARRLDDQGPSALLAPRKPVNAFDDAITSWHLVLVLDHFSRSFLAFRLARREPSAEDVQATLDAAVARAGRAPKHVISDRGTQFRTEYLEWCRRRDAKPRFGAVGRHGSIAVIERFILSLKQELLWRVHVPVRREAMTELVGKHQRWYDEHGPHEARADRARRRCSPARRRARDDGAARADAARARTAEAPRSRAARSRRRARRRAPGAARRRCP